MTLGVKMILQARIKVMCMTLFTNFHLSLHLLTLECTFLCAIFSSHDADHCTWFAHCETLVSYPQGIWHTLWIKQHKMNASSHTHELIVPFVELIHTWKPQRNQLSNQWSVGFTVHRSVSFTHECIEGNQVWLSALAFEFFLGFFPFCWSFQFV